VSCAAGRKIAARLFQLGAKYFCGIGHGDEGTPNGGVFGDLKSLVGSIVFTGVRNEADGYR